MGHRLVVVGEIHGKMNFFGIKFGWLNFSENTIQCVGISPPKYFLKRPSSFCAIAFQSFSFYSRRYRYCLARRCEMGATFQDAGICALIYLIG